MLHHPPGHLKTNQVYPIRSRADADLPKPPQTIVALVPKVGSVGKHRGVVAAKSFCARNAAVPGRQETLAVTARKFPLHSTNSHPAVQTVGLAVLIRSAGPVAQYLVARELEAHFLLPGRSRETRPVRLIHHRDDPTSTANRLVSGDLLHFESLKRSRNAVLGDVVRVGASWRNCGARIASTPLENTSACRHGRGGWHRARSVVPKHASGHPCRARRRVDPNILRRSLAPRGEQSGESAGVQGPTATNILRRSLVPRVEPSGQSAGVQGPTVMTLLGPVQLGESLAFKTLASVRVFAP